MQAWLQRKLDKIEKDFRGGGGIPMVFESQYLCYLECYAVARGGDPVAFWTRYEVECLKDTPKGKAVRGHYSRIEDRDKLVERITQFRDQFEGPNWKTPIQAPPAKPKRKTRAKKPKVWAQKKPVARNTNEGGSDLFDLFGGDE